ncbi:MAG TPA: M17 family peptidase N-terminal domain-containing protein, partial [Dongiaceae bacterium]|nr:M17 family peptidase N-terminal domain-containing protein [Dongiaceae bacterium]
MEVRLRPGRLATRPAGAVAIGVIESGGPLTGAAREVDRASGGAVSALLASGDFRGRLLETAVLYPRGRKPRRVIVVGLGRRETLDPQRVRMASAVAARRARELGAGTLATVIHGAGAGGLDPARAAQAVAEGAVLGHYRHGAYKRDPGPRALRRIELIEHDGERAKTLAPHVTRGAAWAEA